MSKKTSNEGWVGENCMEGGEPIYRTGGGGLGRGPGSWAGTKIFFNFSYFLSIFFIILFSIFVSGIPLITTNQRRVAAWPGDCGTLLLAVFLSRAFSLVPNSCGDITREEFKISR